jgi:hypothetical protein
MADHTIHTVPSDDGMLSVTCGCGEVIGAFTDTLIGRALATSAKTVHRLKVRPGEDPCILPGWEASPQTLSVLERIAAERQNQLDKWGHQQYPDGTSTSRDDAVHADLYREIAERLAREGRLSWRAVLKEEVAEAFAESDPVKLVAELVRVAAVCCAWVEDIESR